MSSGRIGNRTAGGLFQHGEATKLRVVIVEGSNPANHHLLHHHEGNGITKRVRFIPVLSEKLDCLAVVLVGGFRKVSQEFSWKSAMTRSRTNVRATQ